ncbi:Zinc finger CCCH domain-containing protein [Ooceraea biroi]|nr:Zinc finger CCCH domain-containing protein [Ooceraea biroi]
MELGVRYDEELPDYILVMVVNKKSRQQMHDDLNLFLEDCTTAFVDWLHDQVLKKLQKVTVAKKKSSREFVPTVVVKQEGEKKKRKISATLFLEDQPAEQTTAERSSQDKTPKNDKQQTKSTVPNQTLEQSSNKSTEKNVKTVCQESTASKRPQQTSTRDDSMTKQIADAAESSATRVVVDPHQKSDEASSKNLKRSLEASSSRHEISAEKRDNEAKRSKPSEEEKEDSATSSPDTTSRKLKSCVNKPKITSVVSVKNRLGVMSPRKKFETYREKEGNGRYRPVERRFEKPHRYDGSRGRNRNFEADERGARRNRDVDSSRHHETGKLNDIRSRIESSKNERLSKSSQESRERTQSSGSKADPSAKKLACTIKDRLGVVNNKVQKQSAKSQEIADYRGNQKCSISEQAGNSKNIKDRLGPLRNRVGQKKRQSRNEDEPPNSLSLSVEVEREEEEDELDNDDQSSGPVKSHIVAVNRPTSHGVARIEKKRSKAPNEMAKSQLDKTDRGASSDVDEDIEDTRLSSKVIVTPRPLKPLQPTQKRATQSLLLRAVAEANQSVVTQKNPEPSLLDKKPVLKRLKPAPARDVSQNLSVHFNSSKRLVMEKIQVELNTVDNLDAEDTQHEPYVPQAIRDEHMGVVMSLFQRSDDNQKFLVTLNGYNNNLMKEKLGSEDDDEQLEMEVNEEDELALLPTQSEMGYATVAAMTTTTTSQSDLENTFGTTTEGTEDDTDASPKETSGEENNENCNTENLDKTDEAPRKRRKLSPIIYNRSHSPSPTRLKSNASILPTPVTKLADKRPLAESTVATTHLDKSRENCRYWPNCTLGNKCAYFHPPMMCSAFPACKFGDKCAYRHPKCKFGLSCTKPGCVFSHPTQQCKYHPFCTKPACPYSHTVTPIPAAEATSQRAKFTWRRRD